VEQKEC